MDLDILINKAIRLGASDAKVIRTNGIIIEPHLVELCKPPGCQGYGKCANCPPHAMGPQEARAMIESHTWALLFKIDLPPESLLSESHHREFRKVFMISGALEQAARQLGLASPYGLGAGSCKVAFCNGVPCAQLQAKPCLYPKVARPSPEAIGINLFKLASLVGWPIHRIGRDSDPKKIPSAMLMGMVIV